MVRFSHILLLSGLRDISHICSLGKQAARDIHNKRGDVLTFSGQLKNASSNRSLFLFRLCGHCLLANAQLGRSSSRRCTRGGLNRGSWESSLVQSRWEPDRNLCAVASNSEYLSVQPRRSKLSWQMGFSRRLLCWSCRPV